MGVEQLCVWSVGWSRSVFGVWEWSRSVFGVWECGSGAALCLECGSAGIEPLCVWSVDVTVQKSTSPSIKKKNSFSLYYGYDDYDLLLSVSLFVLVLYI
ncbi:hypothetical protein ANANG_G00250030 [Anguilla anguilla]|uniref:Uncharacterized protein n=1 Tax=Anguilla anguilla TaxID=7936 RepID=A0A9D3RQG4_ANGAN|nr:hypothetical protein ANANG_G00250030 [Anguilla anguilla]